MNDTSASVARLVADRHRAMTPAERRRAAASLYTSARAIVEASLLSGLSREQRRLAVARRLYGSELPEAAFRAHARFDGSSEEAG